MTDIHSSPPVPADAQEKADGKRRPHPVLDTLRLQYAVLRDCQPLAIGIHKAILERHSDFKRAMVGSAMKIHTSSTRYLKAMAQATQRFDLDGQPAGEVTDEQRTQAADALRERFRQGAEKKRAEQKAAQQAQEDARRQEKLQALAQKFNQR